MGYCTKCGTEHKENAVYCSGCGQKLRGVPYEGEPQGILYNDGETLQEMIHVAWTKGPIPPRKVLYFTGQNVYMAEGNFLVGMIGYEKWIGRSIEDQLRSDMENEARSINFQELAAKDPNVVVIPYTEITNVVMGKQRKYLNPSIVIKTTTMDYKFTVMEGKVKLYQQYLKSIPTLLGDKVIVE